MAVETMMTNNIRHAHISMDKLFKKSNKMTSSPLNCGYYIIAQIRQKVNSCVLICSNLIYF